MSRKSRRKKERVAHSPAPSKVIFTFAAARMLKDALRLVEIGLLQQVQPLPNCELAATTLEGLKMKLDDMLQCEEWDHETPFDYNEMHILYAAVHMYLVDLSLARNEQLMSTCLQLCKYFSATIEAVPPRQLKAPGNN